MESYERLQHRSLGSVKCLVCGAEANVDLYIYDAPYNEKIGILTLKCNKCGFKISSIIPIATNQLNQCVEIEISKPEDLNTLILIGEDATIEIKDLGIRIEALYMDIGNIVTVDAILLRTIEALGLLCLEENKPECFKKLDALRHIAEGNITQKLNMVIYSSKGVAVLRSYREKNYRYC